MKTLSCNNLRSKEMSFKIPTPGQNIELEQIFYEVYGIWSCVGLIQSVPINNITMPIGTPHRIITKGKGLMIKIKP